MLVRSNEGLEQIESEVKSGVAWLDENHPGWAIKMDLNRLVLESYFDCVICMVSGENYSIGAAHLGLDRWVDDNPKNGIMSIAMGFAVPGWALTAGQSLDWYAEAEKVWRSEIIARQS